MRGVIAGAAVVCALALAAAAAAANTAVLYPNSFGAQTSASWRAQEGQPDTVGNANQALWLEKQNDDASSFAAATIRGLEGQRVQSLVGLEWERRLDGDCNKVAPRWTLVVQGAKGGKQSVVRFGCAQSVHAPGSAPKWVRDINSQTLIRSRVLQEGGTNAMAGTIVSLSIVYDQRGGRGYTVLDNIRVLAKPGGPEHLDGRGRQRGRPSGAAAEPRRRRPVAEPVQRRGPAHARGALADDDRGVPGDRRVDRPGRGGVGEGPDRPGGNEPPGVGPASLTGGAARARWPSRSSKPVRSGNPRLGRFDSCAAPLDTRVEERTMTSRAPGEVRA